MTVSELVRVVGKAMLLHLPQLVQQPGFAALWVAVLNSLAAAAAAGPEGLNDASAAALQNLIIMLHEMVSVWQDAFGGWGEGLGQHGTTGVVGKVGGGTV